MDKNVLIRVIIISLFILVIGSISCDLISKKVEVFIDIETYLKPGEPCKVTVIIDNENKFFLDENGKGFWTIKKKLNDIINIRFEKEGYTAIDTITYKVKPEGNYIKKRIAFRKVIVAPPPSPEPEKKTEISIKIDFNTKPQIAGVNIYRGDEKIGVTDSSGVYHWETTAAVDEKGQIQFRVDHAPFNLKTVPQQLLVTHQGVDIKKRFTIIPHVQKTPLIKAQLINIVDKMPLPNIELRFSDSNDSLITDKDGMIEYKIQETTYKNNVNLDIIDPTDLIIVDGFKPITITTDIPDNIDMVLQCKVSFVIKMAFENLSGEKLSGVNVSVQGGETHQSDRNGHVKIPINSINRKYVLNISKIKYQDVQKEVVPDKRINDYGVIELRGVTGVIIVEDSLSNKPVPFVSIYEDGKNIGQTGSDGRVIVGVFLNTPMKLEFIPSELKTYQKGVKTLKFNHSSEIKRIKLKPQPYDFTFNFMSDVGRGPVEGVDVKYKMLQKQSDSKGNVQIRTYDILTKNGSIDNSFKIAYKSYETEYKCNITPDVRIYKIPTIYLPTRVKVTIKTNPPGGTLKVFDGQGNIVLEGNDPLIEEILPDLYRIEGQFGETIASRQFMISDDMEIVFPIFNPIDLIIQKYNSGAYSQA
ncbi:hypothetical protein KJ656_03135, partial [bacterium]|nr:hypothetical protein [bacterium]